MRGRQASRARPGARTCVARALDAARSALGRKPAAAPGLGLMAGAAGVSPRTLERHFARVLELSPCAVVERMRLDAARQTLRSGATVSVLAAAARHGFDHPGRFATRYARVFGEPPSVTLRGARAGAPPAAPASCGTPILLRALLPATSTDAARARRATDDLAVAISRSRGLVLRSPEPGAICGPQRAMRLEGRVEADCVILSLVHPAQGVVLRTWREPFAARLDLGWANRAVGAVRAVIADEEAERARRTPRRHADVETLVQRARPAALSQQPALVGMALDLLQEALHRDPAHTRALALAGWCRAVAVNHCFTPDVEGERARALGHARRALMLAPDDPEVLTPIAGALSLIRHFDEAEDLVVRSLSLDPGQPEGLRRLGFIQNFRGDGRRAAAAFRRALTAYPAGSDGAIALVGLGIARFILGDYGRSARDLARALDQQPSLAWPHRFLVAAATHAGAHEEARRSLALLRRAFPDLTLDRCAQSDALHAEARYRVLDGLARAGLPR